MPDTDPPVVTPIIPLSGATRVSKDTNIVFTVVDPGSGVDLAATRIFVRGYLAYDGVRFQDGWKLSRVDAVDDGYMFTLVPDRWQYARARHEHIIGVHASDTLANSTSVTWSFTVAAEIVLSSYRFVIGAIRTKDEEG